MVDAPRTARARARAELTAEIKRVAREQLTEVGAAALSVRAVARELGMASSAVYRYFPGRDELLTALIVDAYSDLADVAEAAVASSKGTVLAERWLQLATAIRHWSVGHRHEYALIYGSPVPGYAAPIDTVAPVQRLTGALLTILSDATFETEGPTSDVDGNTASLGAAADATAEALDRVRSISPGELSDQIIQDGIAAWTQLFGHLNFELFGQFHGVVDDHPSFFEAQMRCAIRPVCERLSA